MEGGMGMAAEMNDDSARLEFFSLDLKVEGFRRTDGDGKKSYCKGNLIKWKVKIGGLTLDLLMSSLSNEVNWGPDKAVSLWFFDKRISEDNLCVLPPESPLAEPDAAAPENCDVAPEPVSKPDEVPAKHEPSEAPLPSKANTVAQSNLKPGEEADASKPDIFDNSEEYVGVNDEHFYINIPLSELTQTGDQTIDSNDDDVAAKGDKPPEVQVNYVDPEVYNVCNDPLNPRIEEGALFPEIVTLRKAIRHYAITTGFEFSRMRCDKTRFIAKCEHNGCPWRIHASRLQDMRTIQAKVCPADHNCPTRKLREGKMPTQQWVADRLTDWLKNHPNKGAKDAKEKLESDCGIKLKYSKAWSGRQLALNQIHGKYEESFQLLFNWKAQIEISSPGSIVEIDLEKKKQKMCFKRMFVALKPCVDRFLAGCRPYIGVDASSFTGQYSGQLASATSVDGNNWLYYVAYGFFWTETEDNRKWFMKQLNRAMGCPEGLVICTDACKGLEIAVGVVFPQAEHRECMRHLYGNFIKYYQCDLFTEHLYQAARAYTEGLFKWHMSKIYEYAPDAIFYLQDYHNKIWYRSGFSEISKCDYLTNNVSESFNAQVKHLKGLLLHELVDELRELIMEKLQCKILPAVIKELNVISKNLKAVKVARSDDQFAEVTLLDQWNNSKRHIVDLENKSCSCRQWQVTGKPCSHALAWTMSNRGLEIKDFVHEAAYEPRVTPMLDRADWPQVDLGYKVFPLSRAPGRPKVQRIRWCLEQNPNKKKVRCKRCGAFGHFAKTCKMPECGDDETGEDQPESSTAQQKKRRKPPKKKKTPKKKKQQKQRKMAGVAPPAKPRLKQRKDWHTTNLEVVWALVEHLIERFFRLALNPNHTDTTPRTWHKRELVPIQSVPVELDPMVAFNGLPLALYPDMVSCRWKLLAAA
ncbi:LOW QUALITY PROTEIN: hypothetical protein U9M48_003511 [Paspalum notatum var. saurae]|uniref:Uncharacterized protein n=1 Tax=Paspalum notatum var. saurae TaxID=547442 RepID=A0AAQ3SI93_PASNO